MENAKSIVEQTAVIILAAGKGSRMGRSDLAKVCFEIDSVPAINRIIRTFKALRFQRFVVVVGNMPEQVQATVAKEHTGVLYVYQQPQLGTGHAAKLAAEALANMGYNGNVLVTMGDKLIEAGAIEALLGGFVKQQADFALLTIPKAKEVSDSSGRVFVDETGQALDIIEKPDLARAAIGDELRERLQQGRVLSGTQLKDILETHFADPRKREKAVPELVKLARQKTVEKGKLEKILQDSRYQIAIGGKRFAASQLDSRCRDLNPSLYLFKAPAFFRGVAMLRNDNAQGEYYITDMVRHLGGLRGPSGESQFRVRAIRIHEPRWVQGFNSPDELLAIQDYVRKQKTRRAKTAAIAERPALKRTQYGSVKQWIEKIQRKTPALEKWIRRIYGAHEDLHRQKSRDLLDVLHCYGKQYGYDQNVCIVRAPGRLNLMGRHVDHRGGFANFLAFDRETIAVAGLRDDDNVLAVSTEPKMYKPVEFNIAGLIGGFAWSDWINFVNSDWVRNMLYSTAGDWGNYVKAAMLRLQHKYQDIKVRGLNMAVSGNVPIAAGLSSSSTIVVATLQAAIALNHFDLTSRQFIDLCGEGEWFVGSRGGAGDHAAIYLGQRGKIAQVGYFPFHVRKIIPAPGDYQVMIANSHIQAKKSKGAKHTFNSKITAYNLGFALLKQSCPEIAEKAEYLRDINPETLGCSTSDIYRMLLKVPEFMTRKDFRARLAKEHHAMMETNFSSHDDPGRYSVRGVLLFGAAEIVRAKICMEYLEQNQMGEFGRLMNISHDGDRVSRPGRDGSYQLLPEECSDAYLHGLIEDLKSEDPARVLRAQLYRQPGNYACSTEQIDQMVDIACSVPGVVGAQIAGAGLGGCIMILTKKEAVAHVRKALLRDYYEPNRLEPAIIPCIMVEGAGLAEF